MEDGENGGGEGKCGVREGRDSKGIYPFGRGNFQNCLNQDGQDERILRIKARRKITFLP
jgi:hypothetical protein